VTWTRPEEGKTSMLQFIYPVRATGAEMTPGDSSAMLYRVTT